MSLKENSVTKTLGQQIADWGLMLGFQQIGISDIDLSDYEPHLQQWLRNGHHGEMAYMQRFAEKRSNPPQLHENTQSIIMVRMNYLSPSSDMGKLLQQKDKAYISRYALGRDYHKLIRKRLKQLAEKIQTIVPHFDYRPFADSAPVMEKPLAEKAGLGWIGKNTNLLSRKAGSWFFLGSLFTNLQMEDYDLVVSNSTSAHSTPRGLTAGPNKLNPAVKPRNVALSTSLALENPPTTARNHCGTCTACLDICPTNAFVGPYQLDASRCISYLTIELRGSIPIELRKLMGNRIYGCDDCQIVCPWNRFAKLTSENDFHPRHQLDDVTLIELFNWTKADFLKKTEGSAIRRIGYDCWLRNIAVALGNSPTSTAVINALRQRVNDESLLVREHVQWALSQHEENPTKK